MVNTVKYYRRCRDLGLTQTGVARTIGVDRSSLYRKVHNDENLTVNQVIALMDVLELKNPTSILLCKSC